MINLNIICPNIEQLILKIIGKDLNYNLNKLNGIFPNMNILNISIKTKYTLSNLLRNLIN